MHRHVRIVDFQIEPNSLMILDEHFRIEHRVVATQEIWPQNGMHTTIWYLKLLKMQFCESETETNSNKVYS